MLQGCTYAAVVDFTDSAGVPHQFEAPPSGTEAEVGSTVKVSYDARHPALAHDLSVDGSNRNWTVEIGTMAFVILVGAAFLLLFGPALFFARVPLGTRSRLRASLHPPEPVVLEPGASGYTTPRLPPSPEGHTQAGGELEPKGVPSSGEAPIAAREETSVQRLSINRPPTPTQLESIARGKRRAWKLFGTSTVASLGAALCFLAVGKTGLAASFGAMTLFGIPITLLFRWQAGQVLSGSVAISSAGDEGLQERTRLDLERPRSSKRVQLVFTVLLVLWGISMGTVRWGLASAFKSTSPSVPATTVPATEVAQVEVTMCVSFIEGVLEAAKEGDNVSQAVSAFEMTLNQVHAKGVDAATAWYRAELVKYLRQLPLIMTCLVELPVNSRAHILAPHSPTAVPKLAELGGPAFTAPGEAGRAWSVSPPVRV